MVYWLVGPRLNLEVVPQHRVPNFPVSISYSVYYVSKILIRLSCAFSTVFFKISNATNERFPNLLHV
eukprot:snap_masked-scaffold_29-processed-gene-4.19-mRNA-1 protein AED:1.00 eAED:1.00 QI:0/0/0/0/1/1/2/0/66